jgi:hypothetical protein
MRACGRVGRSALEWACSNGSVKSRASVPASTLGSSAARASFPRNPSPRRPAATGRSKTVCTGCSTLPSARTTAGFARETRREISPPCASSRWRFCAGTTSIPNAGEKPLTVFRNTAPPCSASSKGGKPAALTELVVKDFLDRDMTYACAIALAGGRSIRRVTLLDAVTLPLRRILALFAPGVSL